MTSVGTDSTKTREAPEDRGLPERIYFGKTAFGIAVVMFLAMSICHVTAQERTVTVALIGDSTVVDDSGWGKAFADRLSENVNVQNFAKKGRSSKSWYTEGRLPDVLEIEPDFVLIQFGHNGQPGKGCERETDPDITYPAYLRKYVEEFRRIHASPILVTPVTRRNFNDEGEIETSLTPWANAAKKLASEMKVPLVDLHTASVNYHNKIGPEASMTLNRNEGDITHFNEKGAEAIADLIVRELKKTSTDLTRYLD